MRLRWSDDALNDLDRIAEFNEQRSADWARRVQNRIIARAEELASAPRQGRRVPGTEARAGLIADMQYVLTYAVDADEIIIKAVHSTREAGAPG